MGLVLCACLALGACASKPRGEGPAASTAPAKVQPDNPALGQPPEFIVLPFRFDLSLSPELADALDAAGEQLAVNTTVWALPRGPGSPSGDRVVLSEDNRRLNVRNQSMILEGRFDKVQAARETDGSLRVLVTVLNAPQTPDGPLMDCTSFDAPLFITVETGAQVDCHLVSD